MSNFGTSRSKYGRAWECNVAQCHQGQSIWLGSVQGGQGGPLGSAQLQILDIVCCKVFNDFLCDAGEDGMVCGDLMNDPKQLKHLA